MTRHKELATSVDDIYHDDIILDLENYQSRFMKSKLDEGFSNSQFEIENLDLRTLMDQLSSRVLKTSGRPSSSQSHTTEVKSIETTVKLDETKARKDCSQRHSDRHKSSRYWLRFLEITPLKWPDESKSHIASLQADSKTINNQSSS